MENRPLGNTGLTVSALGFGCGAIGGLLVRGEYPTMRRTVARAIEQGITYFDTASMYGNGQSEVNLGAVLRELRAGVTVGTKVRLVPGDLANIEAAVLASVEGSLRRLGRESVDLIQFHNPLLASGRPPDPGAAPGSSETGASIDTLESVFHAFQTLQKQGKIRFYGITGLGTTDAVHHAVGKGGFHTLQACFNLLNPSAGMEVPARFPFQDFHELIDHCAEMHIGVIAIRVLAGGALSGTAARHPVAAPSVAPIATASEFEADVARAEAFRFLVDEGCCDTMVEAGIRFALSKPGISTALVGISSPEQLELAIAAANRGPLPEAALARLVAVWAGM